MWIVSFILLEIEPFTVPEFFLVVIQVMYKMTKLVRGVGFSYASGVIQASKCRSHDSREKSGSASISVCLCSSTCMPYYRGIAPIFPKNGRGTTK